MQHVTPTNKHTVKNWVNSKECVRSRREGEGVRHMSTAVGDTQQRGLTSTQPGDKTNSTAEMLPTGLRMTAQPTLQRYTSGDSPRTRHKETVKKWRTNGVSNQMYT